MLQHPTSRPTTRLTHDGMVNPPKNYFSRCLAGKHGKLTKKATCRCHQANEGKSIEHFVERDTAVARNRVQDAETTMKQELNNMTTATG
jgi:hypothetical protein